MGENFNKELIEIFTGEAKETLEDISKLLDSWHNNFDDLEPINEIQRHLHTLKGSSKIISQNEISDFIHLMESLVKNLAEKTFASNEQSYAKLLFGYDHLASMIDSKFKQPGQENAKNKTLTKSYSNNVRISVDDLEKLSKLATAVNIHRADIEQNVEQMNLFMQDIDSRVKFLKEQIKLFYLQSDTQLSLPKFASIGAMNEDFDGLELDSYNSVQQQVRNLSDTIDIILNNNDKVHKSMINIDNNLLEQSRATVELEETLIHTRLVAFESIVPRLQRTVKRIAQELRKKVNFECLKVEGDIDRLVLEKLISPLEHMIRNAIDHGIEQESQREKLGKPATGNIQLSLVRKGNEVNIELIDDGRGLSTKLIRKKAISQGLITQETILSNNEIYRLILESGFTTKEELTQISGRGIGMDVVDVEVKKLGGNLTIKSELGKGVRFIIRIPFTLSMNKALIVSIDNNYYAIGLSSISGISRIQASALPEYLNDKPFEYANSKYPLRYLGQLLGISSNKNYSKSVKTLPIILLDVAGMKLAMVVDKLIGSKEIVVQPCASQLQSVREILGATILGGERAVLILDPFTLVTDVNEQILGTSKVPNKPNKSTEIKVLVVDDSITVRKVTSGILKRNDYIYLSAKDGVDALEQMARIKPDIVLLDIEMPKMDGFSVIERMRKDKSLKNVPIVIITSRSGDKHRQRALGLGANAYLVKPYQEDILLTTIEKLVNEHIRR